MKHRHKRKLLNLVVRIGLFILVLSLATLILAGRTGWIWHTTAS